MASDRTLLDKVWDAHTVRELPSGQTQLFIGLHLIHEVTSPQAFAMLRELKLPVRFPERSFATVDHIIPTDTQARPLADALAEQMLVALEHNTRDAGIAFFEPSDSRQGIVHVIGPELGLTQPGMTIACGDSHTSTHGALGAVAFGIGTSQVRDVLATQCLAMARPKLRRIDVTGKLAAGVYAKDVTLTIIRQLGVKGGVGFAYEYAGPVIDAMTIEERLTVCNMSIEGGARCGYVNPDEATIDYLRGREYSPTGDAWERAAAHWRAVASDADATYDDRVEIDVQVSMTTGDGRLAEAFDVALVSTDGVGGTFSLGELQPADLAGSYDFIALSPMDYDHVSTRIEAIFRDGQTWGTVTERATSTIGDGLDAEDSITNEDVGSWPADGPIDG